MASFPRVALMVPTYRRAARLHALMKSILLQDYCGPFRIVIVDNDPEGSARVVADAYRDRLAVEYEMEPALGLARVRNRALGALAESDVYAIFVDDDEVVSKSWLTMLVQTAETCNADVVTGPVISVFPETAPGWIVRGEFYVRARYATGSPMANSAAGNVLVRTSFLRDVGWPLFDTSFDHTGGEDSDFFSRLSDLGARIVWCDEAEAYEAVDESRLTIREVVRRGVRGGTTFGRLSMRKRGRFKTAGYGLLMLIVSTGRVMVAAPRSRGLRASEVVPALSGLGIVMATLGFDVEVYRRLPRRRRGLRAAKRGDR